MTEVEDEIKAANTKSNTKFHPVHGDQARVARGQANERDAVLPSSGPAIISLHYLPSRWIVARLFQDTDIVFIIGIFSFASKVVA